MDSQVVLVGEGLQGCLGCGIQTDLQGGAIVDEPGNVLPNTGCCLRGGPGADGQQVFLMFHDDVHVVDVDEALTQNPRHFRVDLGDHQVVGSSPEILVHLEDNQVTVRPIAGTRPRGEDEASDRALEQDLLADPKELAEHLMLLDLGRNDVGRVARIGTVHPTEEFIIERYSHVMHIVSNVNGKLRDGLTAEARHREQKSQHLKRRGGSRRSREGNAAGKYHEKEASEPKCGANRPVLADPLRCRRGARPRGGGISLAGGASRATERRASERAAERTPPISEVSSIFPLRNAGRRDLTSDV